jgi:hypothetical protein
LEIDLLEEMARRMSRELVLLDAVALDSEERERWQRKADIIAGVIGKDNEAPEGFTFSRAWVMISEHGQKKEACFLLPAGSPDAAGIDELLKTLNSERFLVRISRATVRTH